jgi:NADH-quinone oxidoreductase subunit L
VPLVILAILSLGGGYLFKIPEFLGELFPTVTEIPEDFALMAIASAAGLLGILLAYVMYVARPGIPDAIASNLKGVYTLVYNKYFVDEVYDATLVKPVVGGSRLLLWKGMDAGFIDGIVNGIGARAKNIGGALRRLQSGNARSYATWVAFGAVLVIVAMGVAEGITR